MPGKLPQRATASCGRTGDAAVSRAAPVVAAALRAAPVVAAALRAAPVVAAVGAATAASCAPAEQISFDFVAEIDNAYAFGTSRLLDLGTVSARPHLGGGWNDTDSFDADATSWVWGTGRRSLVDFELREPSPLKLRLTGKGFDRGPEVPMPAVVVEVNGSALGELAVSASWQDFELDVPRSALRTGRNLLSLEYRFPPDAAGVPDPDSGSWLVAWSSIGLEIPEAALRRRPAARSSELGMPIPSRLQYWVPVLPGAELRLDGIEWENVPPGKRAVTLRATFETRQEPLEIELTDDASGWPRVVELPVAEPQFVVVELEANAPGASAGGVAWLEAPRVVGGSRPAALASTEAPCRDCNVILVSIDTLRADRLGVYGSSRDLTPNLDAFRRDAILFANHVAQAPSTLPSHASMLTGLVPQRHGASMANKRPLPPGVFTLARALSSAGYATAAFTGGGQVDPQWRLDQGFSQYGTGVSVSGPPSPLGQAVPRVREWLERRRGPFFLFLHTYEVHAPYTPRPEDYERLTGAALGELRDDDPEHVIASYDAGVMEMDRGFGALVGMLRDLGVYDSTILVVTSDHGEEMGEHGRMALHSHSLNEELMRVPLLFKLDGSAGAGAEFTGVTSSVDLLPSILDRLGIAEPPALDGSSLLGARDAADAIAVSQIDSQNPLGAPGSVRTRRWKLLAITGELRDLLGDPGEANSSTAKYPAAALGLQRRLAEVLLSPLEPGAEIELSEDLQRQLRSLGYIR